jgi:hypothetical protein
LLDYGLKLFPGNIRVRFGAKIKRLLSEWQPGIILVKTPKISRVRSKINTVQALAKSHRVPVRIITRDEIKRAFASERNKFERGLAIVNRFPELSARLPPKRKTWQPERRRMTIFDAAEAGLTYYHLEDSRL